MFSNWFLKHIRNKNKLEDYESKLSILSVYQQKDKDIKVLQNPNLTNSKDKFNKLYKRIEVE